MTLYITLALIVTLISVVLTLFVGKDVNKTIKNYEVTGDGLQDEINRSLEYETESLTKNVKNLNYIYIGVIITCIIVSIGIFAYG